MTECVQQISLKNYPKHIDVTFDAPDSSSDGGVLLLQQVEQQLQLCEKLAALVPDNRQPRQIRHSRLSQTRQRIYQISLGYEDCNDADSLRHDPLFKLACADLPEDMEGLSSQPTLSRFEHAPQWQDIEKMLYLLEENYIQTLDKDATLIVLDIDPTDDPAHGKQEGCFYHGYYHNYIYYPLLVFDGTTGQLVSAILRTGNTHASHGAFLTLERLICAIKARCPKAIILIRGDSGFSVPINHETLDTLEQKFGEVYYVFGQATNSAIARKAKPFIEQAKEAYQQNRQPVRFFGSFDYQAETWKRPHQLVVKAEETSKGSNSRYVVHNLEDLSPALIYDIYRGHGQCENRIKDLKNALKAERLSCTTFTANFFRLILHSFAYCLLHALRKRVGEESLQEGKSQFDTLRLKLLKVSVIVKESARRIWLQLPKAFPLASLFRSLLQKGQLALGLT